MNEQPTLRSKLNALADLYGSYVLTSDEAIQAATKIIKQHDRVSSAAISSDSIAGGTTSHKIYTSIENDRG